nr:dermonecrotic toxin SPH-like [Dermacentor andersoni]
MQAHLLKFNIPEERLVTRRLPFVGIERLTQAGGQLGMKGQVLDMPIDVQETVQSPSRDVDNHIADEAHIKRHGGIYEKRLALLVLDLKTGSLYPDKKYVAGVDIAKKLLHHLWLGVPDKKAMNVLLAVPSIDDGELFRGAVLTIHRQRPDMIDKIGFDITNNEDLTTIEKMYRQLGIRGHRWQGDGVSNCVSFFRPADRMNSIVDNRDAGQSSAFVEKAYQWTIDIPQQLRLSLRCE